MRHTGTLYLSMAAVHLWDVTDKTAPKLTSVYEIEGSYLTARRINHLIYVVVRYSKST